MLRFDERRRGNSLEMTGFIVGNDAQIIPVSTSIIDQMAASVLSPIRRLVEKRVALGQATCR